MRTISTVLGNVIVSNVSMVRVSGYGQYSVLVDVDFDGMKKELKVHSTDSQLWDDLQDADNGSEYLLSKCSYLITQAVEDHVSSL